MVSWENGAVHFLDFRPGYVVFLKAEPAAETKKALQKLDSLLEGVTIAG